MSRPPKGQRARAGGAACAVVLTLLVPPLARADGPPSADAALDQARLHRAQELHPVEPAPRPGPMQAQGGSLSLALLDGAWRAYKVALSPHTGVRCGFSPSCSRFGLDAVMAYGPVRGILLTLDRLERDHNGARRYGRADPQTGLVQDPVSAWCGAVGGQCP